MQDFRSSKGKYSEVIEVDPRDKAASKVSLFGVDMFQCHAYNDLETRPIFLKHVIAMKRKAEKAEPSITHIFLAECVRLGKICRIYSQNIDGLEIRAAASQEVIDKITLLHGSLFKATCVLCKAECPLTEDVEKCFLANTPTFCNQCCVLNGSRLSMPRAAKKVNFLKPSIVLYGETDLPHSEKISLLINDDLTNLPNRLVVIGTSILIPGIIQMIKTVACSIKAKGGKCVYVDCKPLSNKSEWRDVFDIHFICKCDDWVNACYSFGIISLQSKSSPADLNIEDKTKVLSNSEFENPGIDSEIGTIPQDGNPTFLNLF